MQDEIVFQSHNVTDLIVLEWNILLFLVLYGRFLFKGKTSHISIESPFTILYNSVARICIFLELDYQFLEAFHVMICCHYKLIFHAIYWFVIKLSAMKHPHKWAIAKLCYKKCIHLDLFFLFFMKRTIVAKNLNFVLLFPHIYKIFVSKLIFVSTVSPKSFSYWLLSKGAL